MLPVYSLKERIGPFLQFVREALNAAHSNGGPAAPEHAT